MFEQKHPIRINFKRRRDRGLVIIGRKVGQDIDVAIPTEGGLTHINIGIINTESGSKGRTGIGIDAPRDITIIRSELVKKSE